MVAAAARRISASLIPGLVSLEATALLLARRGTATTTKRNQSLAYCVLGKIRINYSALVMYQIERSDLSLLHLILTHDTV